MTVSVGTVVDDLENYVAYFRQIPFSETQKAKGQKESQEQVLAFKHWPTSDYCLQSV
jgi:hypothetical protein